MRGRKQERGGGRERERERERKRARELLFPRDPGREGISPGVTRGCDETAIIGTSP